MASQVRKTRKKGKKASTLIAEFPGLKAGLSCSGSDQ